MPDTPPPRDDLGRSAAGGVRATMIGQAVSIATQLASVIILSRLLQPEEFGLLAMVMAIVAVGEVVREFGLANAAIRAPVLTEAQRSNLFWINTALGLACGAALLLSAPLIADFYEEPRLVAISQVLAVLFVLGGLTTQPKAHLARSLRFKALSVTDVLPSVIGLVVAIIGVGLGLGVWALVAQRVVNAALMLILAVAFDRWVPKLPSRRAGMGIFLRQGVQLLGSQVISWTSRNIDVVVLGYRFGAATTGQYSRAFELTINTMSQLNSPSTKVAVPVLARLQDDPERFNRYLLKGQRSLLFAIVPLLGVGGALAEPLVELVLGAQWLPSAIFVQILAIAAVARVAGYATWWLALAKGKTSATLWVSITNSVLLIASVLIGSMWGATGVAWGYTVGSVLGWLAQLVWYRVAASAPSGQLLSNAALVISMNIAPTAATLAVAHSTGELSSIAQVMMGIAVYGGLWLLTVLVVPVFRSELRSTLQVARKIARR
ncbi:lipopolysaccharide biosynthesis protein [Microbacterium jiangjiandongii]|uniref:lipopolysaccharide biosynthesis protein n=1 Tax=Microbacterium jiangjiandongii TaxID=3049071 RepID=UPI00214A9FEC|nr:lipopolysaccharide biosynthesis protein [Microbacterium sp. zg.Y843]MCR2815874.1 lipopolysaccharide biosynthesis protein [Microbacterium sp. zg.Y843]